VIPVSLSLSFLLSPLAPCFLLSVCSESHASKLKAAREEEDRKLAEQYAANGTPVKAKK
jgi:hypothetical protein